ncbi:HEPN domain-containing protein [Neorhizobium petrolearium]|uniref:HEPN domain-containing protein n=1 Tax=Neorhizobium petrolearium TaxID=515361 RepID=UPI003F820D26
MDSNPTEGFDAALTLTDVLDYLPANKRRELARALEIIFFEVEQFRSAKQSAKKASGKILKVILFGSYARGDWVEDRLSGYRSDYDILIVVNSESFAQEQELWLALEERFWQEQIGHRIETPVVPIVHSLQDVNDQLSRGRPFFVDIARDGKVLYADNRNPLAEPKVLTKEERLAEAKQHYAKWMKLVDASTTARSALGKGHENYSAFLLHQTVEALYHCALEVLTLYSAKSHRLKTLRSKSEELDKRLIAAWPRDTRIARRRFELLSRAYVEARYSPSYAIEAEDLEWLVERARKLQELVQMICRETLD